MTEPSTMKNKQVLPEGTRVKPAYAKLSATIGTVVGHGHMGEIPTLHIKWDHLTYVQYGYMVGEVRPHTRPEEEHG